MVDSNLPASPVPRAGYDNAAVVPTASFSAGFSMTWCSVTPRLGWKQNLVIWGVACKRAGVAPESRASQLEGHGGWTSLPCRRQTSPRARIAYSCSQRERQTPRRWGDCRPAGVIATPFQMFLCHLALKGCNAKQPMYACAPTAVISGFGAGRFSLVLLPFCPVWRPVRSFVGRSCHPCR